jgi:hypothetical protein
MAGRRVVVLLSLLAAVACSPRQRLSPPYPTTLPADQRVEVWQAGVRITLSHLTIDSAAIHGTAAPWRPRCDSCRVSVPRAEVDSLVLLNAGPTEAAAILGATALLFYAWVQNGCRPFFRRCD